MVILDDIIDTGGTLSEAAGVIVDQGRPQRQRLLHPAVLSGPAVERVANSPLHRLVVTDTIPLSEAAKNCPKIVQLSVAPCWPRP